MRISDWSSDVCSSDLYDRKVPILFWWQGIAPEDRREDAMTVDIMPTLASLIGLPVPTDGIDGRCLDILTGPETNCPRCGGCLDANGVIARYGAMSLWWMRSATSKKIGRAHV